MGGGGCILDKNSTRKTELRYRRKKNIFLRFLSDINFELSCKRKEKREYPEKKTFQYIVA